MATSHINGYNDGDIIVSVAGKDATEGHRYLIPAPVLPSGITPELATAIGSGLYRLAISPAQNAATKAREGKYEVDREGKKVKLAEREAVAHFLAGFKPSENAGVETVGAKRAELALDMCRKACAARGLGDSDDVARANLVPWLAGPKGSGKNREEAETALRTWLNESYKVAKRTKGVGTAATVEAVQDW